MRGIFPGKPRATPHAICTAQWNSKRLVVYISGNALVILDRPDHILQTIYQDGADVLNAVAIDRHTGKIAVHGSEAVHIYKPFGVDWGLPKWSLQFSIPSSHDRDCYPVLVWGLSEELLVADAELKIYQTRESEALIWTTDLSSPASLAAISPDGSLIATAAKYDRLVKIWRRRSYGDGNLQFDYRYLPHPSTVTHLQWREHHEDGTDSGQILYTLCGDSKARIWTSVEHHGLEYLRLWSEIDLHGSTQQSHPGGPQSYHVVFIDGPEFKKAIESLTDTKNQNGILEHFQDVCKDTPEICMVLDSFGNLRVWGCGITKSKPQQGSKVFSMMCGQHLGVFQRSGTSERPYQLLSFLDSVSGSQSMVVQSDDSIDWYEGKLCNIFDPARKITCYDHKAHLTGHEGSIEKINRTMRGRAIISRATNGENIIWQQLEEESGTALRRHSRFITEAPFLKSCLLRKGDHVVTLQSDKTVLWSCKNPQAKATASRPYHLSRKALCLLQLPSVDNGYEIEYIAAISSRFSGIVWRICSPSGHTNGTNGNTLPILQQFCTFSLESQDEIPCIVPVDSAGSTHVVNGFLDTSAKDVALSYTKTGRLSTWAARVDPERSDINWVCTAVIETGVTEPFFASGSSIHKIAIVDAERSGLLIWDTKSGQLEYSRKFSYGEAIQGLNWTSTPDNQSILAIEFPYKVVILAQIRYDYLDLKPAWATIREIYTRESTPHPIGDSTWLGSGSLVIGAGNQMFVYDKIISQGDENVKDLIISTESETSVDLFDVVSLLNGPLPVYHPQLLSQCMLGGKLQLVQKILVNLNQQLKFYTEGDAWDSYMSTTLDVFSQPKTSASKSRILQSDLGIDAQDLSENVTEEVGISLNEALSKKSVPFLSSQEQSRLSDLVECVATAERYRRSIDENATRYLLFFRWYMLRKTQHKSRWDGVTWREISWAFHSNSQEILVDLVAHHHENKIHWKEARESGMFMWMGDITALKIQFENVARMEYTKSEDRNPIDCSLYYLALRKKNVLQGLWKMATWHREQGPTLRLLANNFEEARWKTAALKNAYALMGRRRFAYAAAFFLLAGNIRDAVNICASQIGDIQLAVAIARVYNGDSSPVLHDLLEEKVLPLAAVRGDRWMASWAFQMLGKRDMAIKSLITPLHELLDSPGSPSRRAESYLATDPALIILYQQLRVKTFQNLTGASEVTPKAEWEFVISIARLYNRMGCNILALDLVRNWEFLKLSTDPRGDQREPVKTDDPRTLSRRRSSLVANDLPSPRSPTARKTQYFKSPPVKVFEEPTSNSLLDSFGF